MAQHYHHVLAEGVLGLRTNMADFRWSYGSRAPVANQPAFEECAVRLTVDVHDDEIFPSGHAQADAERHGKYQYFSGTQGAHVLRYQRTFAFGARLQLEARGLAGDEPIIRVNRPYYRYIHYRFMNLHSVGYIATDVASLLLLNHGYAPLYAAALATEQGAALILAPPNGGKTLSALMACRDHGASFMSEDLAITDGHTLYAVPWTSTLRYYATIDRSARARALETLKRMLPVLELVPGSPGQSIGAYQSPDRIVSRAPITHLFILEHGVRSVQRIDRNAAFRVIVNLNRFAFNYQRAPLLTAYEYFNPEIDVWGAMQRERAVLRSVVEAVPEVVLVSAPDPTKYARSIIEVISANQPVSL